MDKDEKKKEEPSKASQTLLEVASEAAKKLLSKDDSADKSKIVTIGVRG